MISADTIALSPDDVQDVAAAAALSPVEYGRVRGPLAERLGCRVVDLDAEVYALRAARNGTAATDAGQQGTALALADPESWPAPVDGAELLDELAATFRRFLAMPEHAPEAMTLWTVHAHAHDAAAVSPVLALTSPEKRCGKTTGLELLGGLTPRPLPAANITASSLFRGVEKYRPTLLLDEADSFLRNSDELRGILNSGHRRRSAVILRNVGDDHEPKTFVTWAPKAIGMIGRLPDTLSDRAIEIVMRRRRRDEPIERLRLDRLDALEPLRRRAWRWTRDHLTALEAADPDVPDSLHDRAADNWRPLLAIADLAGGEWPSRARQAARSLSGDASIEDDSARTLLLADLRDLFAEREADRLPSAEIVEELVAREDRPWPEWRKGRPLTVRQLAQLLKPFGIGPKTLRVDEKTRLKGYEQDAFADTFARYLPADPCRRDNAVEMRLSGDSRSVTPVPVVTDAKLREPAKQADCHVVTDEQAPLWSGRVE